MRSSVLAIGFVGVLQAWVFSGAATASIVTYAVDWTGVTGDYVPDPIYRQLRLTGTITADTVTDAILSSSMVITQAGLDPLPLASLPSFTGDVFWDATLTELRLYDAPGAVVGGAATGELVWWDDIYGGLDPVSGTGFATMTLSGDLFPAVALIRLSRQEVQGWGLSKWYGLLVEYPEDGGMLFARAVPAPASLICWSLLGLAGSGAACRSRRAFAPRQSA